MSIEERETLSEVFFYDFKRCRDIFNQLKDDDTFRDELEEIWGFGCMELFNEIFSDDLPFQ